MKYNTLSDHRHVFEIPELMAGDRPMWAGMTDLGADLSDYGKHRWAYTIATGPYDADVRVQGDDLRGHGNAAEMVTALLGFYSAYAEGELVTDSAGNEPVDLVYDGDIVATGETAGFIKANGERFGIADSELDNGYLAYTDTYWNEYLSQYVKRAFPTGKEDD